MTTNIRPRIAEQIAIASRMLVAEGILCYSGHVSSRIPGTDHFMIQSASDSRADLDPSRILTVDKNGKVIDGDLRPPLELALHVEMLKARPDVGAVLHCHMEEAIAFTMMKGVKLLPMRVYAKRWGDDIPVHHNPGHIATAEQGQALAATLGDRNAALIRAHGIVMTAESVPALFVDAVHFAETAKMQLMVMQAGQEPLPLNDEEMEMISSPREFHVAKLWNYYVRQGQATGRIPEDWHGDL